MTLTQLQKDFANFVYRDELTDSLKSCFESYSTQELESRLGIYKNNTFHSLIEALKELYPAVMTTIGNDLFSSAAKDYLVKNPPKSAAMIDFGHDFPKHLSQFDVCKDFLYLPDLAKADLYHHLSYHSEDAESLSPENFAALDIELLAKMKLRAHPSVRLLQSDFAIFDIWQLAKHDDQQEINADQQQKLLFVRPEEEVNIYQLDHGSYEFIKLLSQGLSIEEALSEATEQHPNFNAAQAITFIIHSGYCIQLINGH